MIVQPDQSWRIKPPGDHKVFEGNDFTIQCAINDQRGQATWNKDGEYLFHSNRIKKTDRTNVEIEGDPKLGVHNLVVRNASANDAGEYKCQISPALDDGKHRLLRSSTRVIVLKQQAAPDSQPDQQAANRSAAAVSAATAASLSASNTNPALYDTTHLTSQPRARDIQDGYTKLPGDQQAPSSLLQLSTSALHQPPSAGPSNSVRHFQHAPLFGSLAGWPTLLLVLATVLLALNVYLVVSLVKRHRRNRKGALAAGQPTGESSPDDMGSSGGCSAGTASSGLGASDLGASDPDTSGASLALHSGVDVPGFGPATPKGLDVPDRAASVAGSLYHAVGNVNTSASNMHLSQAAHQLQLQLHHQHPHPHQHPQSLHQQHAFAITPLACLPPHLAAADEVPTAHVWNGQEYVAIESNGWMLDI